MAELRTTTSTAVLRTIRVDRPPMGPRRAQRHAEYLQRRALLGGEDGRNAMVDMCRALDGLSMVRRANLDRKRGVRR